MDISILVLYLPIIVSFFVGAVLCGFIVWLLQRAQSSGLRERVLYLSQQQENADQLEARASQLQDENSNLRVQIAELQQKSKADAEKLVWLENAQTQMRDAFQSLASESLQKNVDEFMKRANEQMTGVVNQLQGDWKTQKSEFQGLVDPLKTNLQNLDGHVRELEQRREGAYKGIEEQLRNLRDTHVALQNTTSNLVGALKSL